MDKDKIKRAIYDILVAIGENPERDGLKDTPKRVSDMYEEIFSGIKEDPNSHLRIFKEEYLNNEFVLLRDIPVHSMCEHHMLPFVGVANVVYMPKDGNIIGLSKLSRIVNCYARRLQVQERLTSQISGFLFENMEVHGVGVMVKAEHMCMTMRGVKSLGTKTVTLSFNGSLKDDENLKQKATMLLLGEDSK